MVVAHKIRKYKSRDIVFHAKALKNRFIAC